MNISCDKNLRTTCTHSKCNNLKKFSKTELSLRALIHLDALNKSYKQGLTCTVHGTRAAWSAPCEEQQALDTPIPVFPRWWHYSPRVTCLDPAHVSLQVNCLQLNCDETDIIKGHSYPLHWNNCISWINKLTKLNLTSVLERMGTSDEITVKTIGEISFLTCMT